MNKTTNKKDIGILLIRLVLGTTMFAFHGLPKLTGGTELWQKIGAAMGNLGIQFFPVFWGFSAAITETFCALLIALGLWTRPASILLAFTMLIAALSHLARGDGFSGASHAIELCTIFVALFLLGPGRYSIDKK